MLPIHYPIFKLASYTEAMENLKHRWKGIPTSIRKPLVLVVGCLLIIAAAATGWLPGPGGIPLFIAGIAVLATEFAWAKDVRDWTLDRVHDAGKWYRRNRIIGTIGIVLCVAAVGSFAYFMYGVINR